MTALTDREAILYPHTEGGWPLCMGCFRHRADTAHAIDPRTGTLDLLCGDCCRALAACSSLPLLSEEELAETWLRLARLHQNHEIGDNAVARALVTLAPGLSPEDGTCTFELLKEMLLKLQEIRSDMADPAAYEGGLEHAEHEADADRKYAITKLAGGAS
jgi:hypothetical protein